MKSSQRNVKQFNGPAIIVAMFREIKDWKFRNELYGKLQNISPILAKLVDHTEFMFTDIYRLENKSIQKILTRIPQDQWLVAWKLANEPVKIKLLENMSDRRREDFLVQVKNQPRMLKRQVIRTQWAIASSINKMLSQGELQIRSKNFKDLILNLK